MAFQECHQQILSMRENNELKDWVKEVDKSSGEEYYYHVDSGLVQWEKPEVLGAGHEGQDEWIKIYSPGDKKYYYYSIAN